MQGALGLTIGSRLDAARIWALHPCMASGPGSAAAYGSGHFGTWIEDEFGLPAFQYTCNQSSDPNAVTQVQPGVLMPTEHIHQVGNDRIIALASNYGHVRVRQDEGCPKFLNDFDPETHQFGGGLGYLTDGQEDLSTYTDGSKTGFERIFGIGYYRKRISGNLYSIDQVISAPFGDDPVLLSAVTITNHRDTAATLRWIEYWGCQPYQFSYRAAIESTGNNKIQTQLRREFGRRFGHEVSKIGNFGLIDTKHFSARSPEEEAAWERAKAYLRAHPNGFTVPVPALRPGTEFECLEIPRSFLVSLDGPVTGFSSDAAAFFGPGGPASPTGLKLPLDCKLENGGTHSGLLLERTVPLGPGEKKSVRFLYGYLPDGFALDALVAKYQRSAASSLRESAERWKQSGMRFEVPAEPWVKRESTWNHYYLRSSQTFDDYFGEHILSQNGFYQYTMGFQGAARDPLQHSLPFLFSDPEIVRSVLRYTLKEVRDDGSLPYGIVGHGVIAPMLSDNASDLPLWLLWTVSEYVLATRDMDFLSEEIPLHFSQTPNRRERVRNLLERCYQHQVKDVGVGQHGIMRMLVDDWNDGLIYTWAGSAITECIEQSESVLNSAMAAWVFGRYAQLLEYAGTAAPFVREVRASADQHREATRAQWNGKWFRRAWLGPKLGWLGETTLWIEPQPWAILAGATTDEQSRQLVQTMNKMLRHGPLGAEQMSDGPDMRSRGSNVGTLELGAIWPSLNQTLVWALAGIDSQMAWEEWKRNSFATHAEAYPDIWYGVWSGNDSYNSPISKHPGGAANEPFFHGTDMPVLNLHSHACYLYAASKLLGIEFTETGLKINLRLRLDSYRFDSPLIGVVKDKEGYQGWYAPSRPGTWKLELTLPEVSSNAFSRAIINGRRMPVTRQQDGTIAISGSSTRGRPLRWRVSS